MHTDQHQTAAQTLLSVRNLSFGYDSRPLCEDLSFALNAGDWHTVIGPNGAGKTTLLRTLCGLSEALSGEIRFPQVKGANGAGVPPGVACYIGHRNGLKAELSVRENLSFYAALSRAATNARCSVAEAAEQMGLTDELDKPCVQLSQGQLKRVALCRLLAEDHRVWFLDEPLAGLDDDSATRLLALVSEHLAGGGCALVATHRELEVPGRAAGGELNLAQHQAGHG